MRRRFFKGLFPLVIAGLLLSAVGFVPSSLTLILPTPTIEPVVSVPHSSGLEIVRVPAIGDRVWLDTDGDGVQDAGELGAAGVTLELWSCYGGWTDWTCSWWVVDTVVTGSDGSYSFVGLDPTRSYVVRVKKAPFTYEISPPDATNDDLDSDVDPAAGKTVKPKDTGAERNWDIGLVPPPLTLILVPTLTPIGIEVAPETTTEPVVSAPQSSPPILARVPAIGDRVWLDVDGDGMQDTGELGAAGVTLELWHQYCGWIECSWWADDTAVSGSDGSYSFVGLDPTARYLVRVKTAPFSFEYSPADAIADDALDSDVQPAGKSFGPFWTGDSVKPKDAGADRNWDIGLVPPPLTLALAPTLTPIGIEVAPETTTEPVVSAPQFSPPVLVRVPTIGDRVWLDTDGDGVQDTSELGAAGVTLELWHRYCGWIECGWWADDTAVTGSDGSYSFVGLDPTASYLVRVKSAPFSFEYSPPDATDDTLDSDVRPAGKSFGPFWTGDSVKPKDSGADRNWDIGLVPPPLTLILVPTLPATPGITNTPAASATPSPSPTPTLTNTPRPLPTSTPTPKPTREPPANTPCPAPNNVPLCG